MCKPSNLVAYAWRPISKYGFSCKTYSWNLGFTNRNWTNFLSCWGVDNFKMLLLASGQMDRIITIVKNWHDDPHANCKPNSNFKQYLKIEKVLVKDNYNLTNMIFWRITSWWWITLWARVDLHIRELVLQLGKGLWFFIELGFNSSTSFGLVLGV